MMYWNVGPTDLYRARRIELTTWMQQGEKVIIPAESANSENRASGIGQNQLHWGVVRGEHRLADSQFVRIMNLP